MKYALGFAALAAFIYFFGIFIVQTLIVVGIVLVILWAVLGGRTKFTRTLDNGDGTKTVIVKRYKWFTLISAGQTTSRADS